MKKKKKKKEQKPKQLDLGMKDPFKNKFLKLNNSLQLALLKFEVKKFLKDPLVWATFVVGLVLVAQQIYLIFINLDSLPTYLPIFRYFISVPQKLTAKDYIIIFPTISTIALLLSFLFTSRYYNSEKSLTKVLLFSSLLCTISQSLILIDLINTF